MLDSAIINVSFRIFFVRKIKGWSSPFSLNNTNWNAFKQVINNYTIYYWSQVITSSTFKSWHKKRNSISIPYRTSTKLSSLNFSKKTTTTTNTGISNWDLSHKKHKQDSLNNKPKTDSQPPDFDQSSNVQLLCLPKISGSCGYTPHTLETINFTDLISIKLKENLINLKISTMIHSLKLNSCWTELFAIRLKK